MSKDELTIEILADGTIKVITNEIGQANHASAEAFTREMARLAGGEHTVTRTQGHAHAHVHTDQTQTH